MQPLSAAHLLWLEAVNSPVLSKDGECSADDLLVAAKLCSAPIRLVNGTYTPDTRFKATIRDMWRLAMVSTNQKRFLLECKRWAIYCEDFLDTPGKYDTPGKKGRNLSAPAVFATAVIGTKLFGEERAWSMPFGMLRTCLDVYAEANGAELRFMPSEDEQEEIDRQLAEAEKRGAELLAKMKKENPE
jgi:hypothetical protein